MSDLRSSANRGMQFLALAATLTLAGCQDTPTVPEPPLYTASPDHQWAGGAIEMVASGGTFEAEDVILRATDTIAVVDQATERVSLRLPTDANGPTTLTVWREGRQLGEVTTEAYGFEELTVYPGRMDDMISEVPVPRGVSVAARMYEWGCCGDTGGGFVWIYPSTGIHRTFPGTPDLPNLFRVGVDPLEADVYYEYRPGTPEECFDYSCTVVHKARIVGGDLVDLGWVNRPCNRWGCEPLAGDIWIMPDAALTCRVVSTPAGETCELISVDFGDDPQGIERLWSRDVGLSLGPPFAFRLSTGERLYRLLDHYRSGVPDESRGLFYLSARVDEWPEEYRRVEIVTVQGDTGEEERAFELVLTCPGDATPPTSCGEPELGFDPLRDLLFLLRGDTRTLQARDPVTFELRGEIKLPDEIGQWYHAQVLVDDFTQRVFVVMSGASLYDENLGESRPADGTPVVAIRLPPP